MGVFKNYLKHEVSIILFESICKKCEKFSFSRWFPSFSLFLHAFSFHRGQVFISITTLYSTHFGSSKIFLSFLGVEIKIFKIYLYQDKKKISTSAFCPLQRQSRQNNLDEHYISKFTCGMKELRLS